MKTMCLAVLLSIFAVWGSGFAREGSIFSVEDEDVPTLVFVDEDAIDAYAYIQNNQESEAYQAINYQIKHEKVKLIPLKDISPDNQLKFTDIAVNIDQLANDPLLQKYLSSLLHEGKKVYLFGEKLTLQQYKEYVDLDDSSIEILEKKLTTDEIKRRKEEKLEKPRLLVEPSIFQVIGYSLDRGSDHDLFFANFAGEGFKIESQMYLDAVISNMIHKKNSGDYGIQTSSPIYSGPDYVQNIYDPVGIKVGSNTTDYTLFRDFAEKDTKYDYFSIKDYSEVKWKNYGNHLLAPQIERSSFHAALFYSTGTGPATADRVDR
jgi:hypothetical protein